MSVKRLFLSVLIDRIVMVAALVVRTCSDHPAGHCASARARGVVGSIVLLVAGLGGFLLLGPVERILGRWRRSNLGQLILHAATEIRYVGRGLDILGLIYGVLSGVSAALAGYCIARSLNINVGPVSFIAVMSLVAVAVALPISAAGWASVRLSLVTLLGLMGVDRSAALLLSVEFGLMTTLLSLPGGLIWLLLRSRSKIIDRIEP